MSRRTVLRGAGATLALPLLDAMIPAATALAQTAATPKPRFVGCFVPHGVAPGYWVPDKEGALAAALPFNWKPLEPFVNQTVIMSGLHSRSAEPPPGATGADHWVAAAFMCADKPKKTAGADIRAGTTIDQIIAQKIGQENLMPSMQCAVEDPGANSQQLRRGLQLHLHQHHLLVLAHRSAADGAESAGDLRAHVRRRQHAGAARQAPKARRQHSGLAHRQPLSSAQRIERRRTARGWTTTPTTSARSSAGCKSP